MNECRAVVFDMDGTLLDTIEDIADSMNAALNWLGFPAHQVKRYLEFVGEGIEVLAVKALPEERRDDGTIASAIDAMRQEYRNRWSKKTRPFPGIPELLDGLAQKDIRLSILSNKMDAFTKAMASSLLHGWEFKEVRGLTPEIPRKPDPTGALICAERMGVDPGECILLGDSAIDMQTACSAGMVPFGAMWGYSTREELIKSGARVLLEDPRDLLGYILKQHNTLGM